MPVHVLLDPARSHVVATVSHLYCSGRGFFFLLAPSWVGATNARLGVWAAAWVPLYNAQHLCHECHWIFYRILNLEAKKPLGIICWKLKQFFIEWFVSIPPWDVYHKFNTEIHGWWESANILIFVFIWTLLRFYNKYE